jgi:thiol-disulfide isomerase/thioredoxin
MTMKVAMIYLALALGANAAQAADIEALKAGDMRKLVVAAEPAAASTAVAVDPDGGEHVLADWRGKVVLLNFWATWCAPCRAEMPSLDALQAAMGGDDFAVVPVATGRNSVDGIRRFFDETAVTGLPILMDRNNAMARDMAVLGLPITVLLDREGREVARLRGEADWNAPEARAVIDALIAD